MPFPSVNQYSFKITNLSRSLLFHDLLPQLIKMHIAFMCNRLALTVRNLSTYLTTG